MSPSPASRILLIEDAVESADLIAAQLEARGFEAVHAASGAAGLRAASESAFDAVLLDLNLPEIGGLEVLAEMRARGIGAAVVVLTANASVDMAVAAIRAGAMDYLVKPCDFTRLEITLRNVLERRALSSQVKTYQERYESEEFCGFIGSSVTMQGVYRAIEAAASSKATVFITGESGTGKELCAAAIHELSPQRKNAFVALNCAAIPPTLMESEIFGHTKGAFTGATSARDGAVRRADGGTLFLDEICDLPLELQAKLLRLVQMGSYRAVGSDKMETADLRYVCATNRDPVKEVAAGRFREDLFYRMHVIPIALPPLRERGQDVLAIAARLLRDYAREEGKSFEGFDDQAARTLMGYSWPGNVRELQNTIRRVVVFNDGPLVTSAMLPAPLLRVVPGDTVREAVASLGPQTLAPTPAPAPATIAAIRPLAEVVQDAIEHAVALCAGNIRQAARLLQVDPSTIYRKRGAGGAFSKAEKRSPPGSRSIRAPASASRLQPGTEPK